MIAFKINYKIPDKTIIDLIRSFSHLFNANKISNTPYIIYRNENGLIHRDKGPAIISNESLVWCENGKIKDGLSVIEKGEKITTEKGTINYHPDYYYKIINYKNNKPHKRYIIKPSTNFVLSI